MENAIVRQRYARRPVVARRRKRVSQVRRVSMRQIIGRQTVICLILLVMIAIVKNINITITDFITDQVKYVLSYNTELENVFSYVDKLASDIKNSVIKTSIDDTGDTEAMQKDTVEAMQKDTAAESDSLRSDEDAVTGTVSKASAQNSENSKKITITDNSTIENRTIEANKTTEGKSETAVLSANSETMTSEAYDMLVPVDGLLITFFGEIPESITGNVKIHKGVDISVKDDGNVKAALDGVVKATGSSPQYGAYIEILHSNSMSAIYANCSTLHASEGDHIKRGDIIASIGNTGTAAGSHLHFEVWVDGTAVDPLEYINIPVR